MTCSDRAIGVLAAGLVIALLGTDRAYSQDATSDAQRFFPRQGYLLTGYGGAGYRAIFADGETPNTFSAIFAPIMLFQVSDRFLFEGELEFEIEEGVTATSLEYAQVDVALTNNLTLVAGKFLLPFNVFSERLHPTWINRLVSGPALYGGHGALTPTDPLLPVLSDIGVQLRGAFPVGRFSTITAETFVSQGPMLAAAEHDEAGEEDGHDEASPADLAFGGDFTDTNEDKMIGGRIGFGLAPYVEVNVSGMTGAYDAAGNLRFSALGVHLEGRYKHVTVHGEFIQTWQDLEGEEPLDEQEEEALPGTDRLEAATASQNEAASENLARQGYWVEVDYRWNKWQPVLRFTQLFEAELDGEPVIDAGRQLALGLDYWIEPALALKVEYLINNEEHSINNNRLAVQLAFGF